MLHMMRPVRIESRHAPCIFSARLFLFSLAQNMPVCELAAAAYMSWSWHVSTSKKDLIAEGQSGLCLFVCGVGQSQIKSETSRLRALYDAVEIRRQHATTALEHLKAAHSVLALAHQQVQRLLSKGWPANPAGSAGHGAVYSLRQHQC